MVCFTLLDTGHGKAVIASYMIADERAAAMAPLRPLKVGAFFSCAKHK